jgi:hypothetical protein
MSERPGLAGDTSLAGIIALLGFVLVATEQVTNMILARGLAGTVPPFTLAFFRWPIIAAGLGTFRHRRTWQRVSFADRDGLLISPPANVARSAMIRSWKLPAQVWPRCRAASNRGPA